MQPRHVPTATAIALILGLTAAHAQTSEKPSGAEPQRQETQPTQQRTPDAKAGHEQGTQHKSDASPQRKSESDRRSEGPAQQKSQKSAEPSADTQGKANERKSAEPTGKANESRDRKSAEPAGKANESRDRKSAEPAGKAGEDRTQHKAEGDRQERPGSTAEKKSDDAQAKRAGTESRTQLSQEQQTRVRDTLIKSQGPRLAKANFALHVGTRVPRSVKLAPLPTVVINLVPEYRGYSYVVVQDDIVIIDPASYEIVYVLPAHGRTAGLGLSDTQISFVLRNIDLKNGRRLGIGGPSVGEVVPRSADLRPFPARVVSQLPELREYRYVVYENEIAIVDPGDLKIALVTRITH